MIADRGGRATIRGIEAQQWAALSLFLQYLSNPDFDRIELEPINFHDFNLVFNDGHKIICESKCKIKKFTYANLKELLGSTLKKHSVNSGDIILVVCLNLSEGLANDVRHIKFWPEKYEKEFKSWGFNDDEIGLITKVKFWRVSPGNSRETCSALLAEYFDFWVPKEELFRFSGTLKQDFDDAASKGLSFTGEELRAKIRQLGDEVVKNTGFYDEERRNPREMAKNLVKALKNDSDPVWAKYPISALSSQPYLLHFVSQKIRNKCGIDLSKWNDLWQLNRQHGFSFNIFDVFTKNLNSTKNRKYILNYIAQNASALRGFYRIDFFVHAAVKIIDKILKMDPTLASEVFYTIKTLMKDNYEEVLYVKNNRDRDHQNDFIAGLLSALIDKVHSKTEVEIAEYCATSFDLIHGHNETPGPVFSALHKYLVRNWGKFPERFLWLVGVLRDQYGKLYNGRLHDGWDHAGSTGSFMGSAYHVSDRLFVEVVLKCSLNEFYENSPQKAWQFIKDYCITTEKKVSNKRPDFLNRAALGGVLKRYQSENKSVSQEALEILKEFVLSTKGIPGKYELIYQEISGDNFTDEQKWQLVQVSLVDKYDNLPITPFVEKIVVSLAKSGHREARNALQQWFNNSDYFKKFRIVDNAIPNIEAFIDTDLNFAVSLYEQFIGNTAFINKEDEFDTYEAAEALRKILSADYDSGIKILKELILLPKPTINQQILISHSFFSYRSPNEKDDANALGRIFKEFVAPNLKKFSDPNYLTHSHSRASFLQFARKLAMSELVDEALTVVKAFINDPDPYLPGRDPEDPKDEYNEQKRIEEGDGPGTITSVRGSCAYTLASFPPIPSRHLMPEIVQLTGHFLNDPNWYVKHMACFPLKILARNRLSVMPPKMKSLYLDLNDNLVEALKLAKKIESMAFKFLEEVSKASYGVQKSLAESALSPFDNIRALNQADSEKMLGIIKSAKLPLQKLFIPFVIYLAEFRGKSNAYKGWRWTAKGYYDDLKYFNSTPFKAYLKDITLNGNAEIRSILAWESFALIQEAYKDQFGTNFPIALRYLKLLVNEYDHGVFENIYRFIDECIDTKFKECFELWKESLKVEKAFFDVHFDPYRMHWWAHHDNGRIILKIQDKLGNEEFMKWVKFLSQYPEGSRLEGFSSVVEALIKMNLPKRYDKEIKAIFKNLINKRKEVYYTDLEAEWEKLVCKRQKKGRA